MMFRIALLSMLGLGLIVFAGAPARAADCNEGNTEAQIACLSEKVAKLEELMKDSLKWNDRIALINEDMRLFPRCLENPGPDSRQLTDVFATSCAKTSSQAGLVRKAYSVGR